MIHVKSREPFFLKGNENKTGILLIHGFTGSPAELQPLGEYLNEHGYTVFAPLLAGHGTSIEDMEKTRWNDWWISVEQGYEKLKIEGCQDIIACGHSMGGILALKLALNYPLKAVISICAPIYLTDKRAYFSNVTKMFLRYHKKPRKHRYGEELITGYDRFPMVCVPSLIELINQIKPLLGHVEVPALILQAELDTTVEPRSGEYIYKEIGSREKQYITYEKSGHIITIDKDKEQVMKDILLFLRVED